MIAEYALNDRKRRILEAIIQDYIDTAEPVGSQHIRQHYHFDLSPATIRNEMSDLEEEGYIKQPHTSAGRIPADKGYRFFVDNLMKRKPLNSKEEQFIQASFSNISRDIEEILHQTLKILSTISNYCGVVLAPSMHRSAIKVVQLVLMDSQQILVVMITNLGVTKDVVLSVPAADREKLDQEELNKISRLLTERLQGITFDRLDAHLMRAVLNEMPQYKDILSEIILLIQQNLLTMREDRVYWSGIKNMSLLPEFNDLKRMHVVLDFLEQERPLAESIRWTVQNENDLAVRIGEENHNPSLRECSTVTIPYTINDQPAGFIGLIGPTRMEYDRMATIISELSKKLSRLLSEE